MPAAVIESTLDDAVENFRRDGYLVIRGFFDQRQTDQMLDNVRRYTTEVVPTIEQEHVYRAETGDDETIFRLTRLRATAYARRQHLHVFMRLCAQTNRPEL